MKNIPFITAETAIRLRQDRYPMLSYHGGKWLMAAKRLTPPQRDHVVEPFAGSAGYSVYWRPKKVTLVERDPVVFGVWDYLQRAGPKEILALPGEVANVDDLPAHICQEAKWLIGFWLNHGIAVPIKRNKRVRPGSFWARRLAGDNYLMKFWSADVRERVAYNASFIADWTIIHGSWEHTPDIDNAHWHVDPPYQHVNTMYRYTEIDYTALAHWCRERVTRYDGFVEVCETSKATWLPFQSFKVRRGATGRGRKGFSDEAVYRMGRTRPEHSKDLFGGHQDGKYDRAPVA